MSFVPRDEDIYTVPEASFPAPVRGVPLSALGISVYLVEVTPKLAELWLKGKNKNRSMHLSQLNKLKRALEQDRWEINGETIIFDAQGRLIEGQHRLQAVVDTDTSLWSLIVVGIDQDRFKTMGQGSKRSAGDILSIRGEKDARNLAAALRWVWRYEHRQMMNPHPLITDDELADTIWVHQEIVDSITYGHQAQGLAAPGMVTALHYLCSRVHKADANDFFWRFTKGQNLDEGHPILILRNSLMKSTKLRRVMRDERKAPMIVVAWNLLRKDPNVRLKDARRLGWHGKVGQLFPVIQ
jgi:hypothetical protein